MGRRLDLIEMFGIPEKIRCGNCKKMSYPYGLSEYSDELIFKNGTLIVKWYCGECETPESENEIELNIRIRTQKEEPFDDYYRNFPFGDCIHNFQCGGAYVCSETNRLCNSIYEDMRCGKFEWRNCVFETDENKRIDVDHVFSDCEIHISWCWKHGHWIHRKPNGDEKDEN